MDLIILVFLLDCRKYDFYVDNAKSSNTENIKSFHFWLRDEVIRSMILLVCNCIW